MQRLMAAVRPVFSLGYIRMREPVRARALGCYRVRLGSAMGFLRLFVEASRVIRELGPCLRIRCPVLLEERHPDAANDARKPGSERVGGPRGAPAEPDRPPRHPRAGSQQGKRWRGPHARRASPRGQRVAQENNAHIRTSARHPGASCCARGGSRRFERRPSPSCRCE